MRRRRRKTRERPSRLPFGFERHFRRLSRRAQLFGLGLFSTGILLGGLLLPLWVDWMSRIHAAGLAVLLLVWTATCYGCAWLLDALRAPEDSPPPSPNRRRWEQAGLDEAYDRIWFAMPQSAFLALVGALAFVVWLYVAGYRLWSGVLAAALVVAFLLVRVLLAPQTRGRRRTPS